MRRLRFEHAAVKIAMVPVLVPLWLVCLFWQGGERGKTRS